MYEVKNQHLVAPHRTWQTQLGERWVVPVPMLGAGRVVEFHSQQLPGPTVHNNRPTVLFTDDSGIQWEVDFYGELEEVPANGPLPVMTRSMRVMPWAAN